MGFRKKMHKRMLTEFGVRLLSAYENRLDEAVRNDYKLLERTAKYRPGVLDKADSYKHKYKAVLREIETNDVWNLMERKKPDLYDNITSDRERKEWADRELQAILNYLKS